MEIIIAVLSIMVTLLIGWQIYTIISINRIINRRISRAIKKSKKKTEKDMMGVMAIQLYRSLDVYRTLERADLQLLCYIDCLSLILSSRDKDSIMLMARDFNKFLMAKQNISISAKDRKRLIDNIYKYKVKKKRTRNDDNADIDLLERLVLIVTDL